MPQPNHLGCYHKWVANRGQICQEYQPRGPNNTVGLVFEKASGNHWKDLIPQVIWRGTDYPYLPSLKEFRKPNFEKDVLSKVTNEKNTDANMTTLKAMREIYDQLSPRWKGVVLTAEAERDAKKNDNNTPWVNIKFPTTSIPIKGLTTKVGDYAQFQKYGIPAIGEKIWLFPLSMYKYHIDLGSIGGTTWSGTLEKLAMPGLLFHHETPAEDYFHKRIKPWVHYVPVISDLTNLKERYEWAESHQEEAQKISERATTFVQQSFGTVAGFSSLFNEFYKEPLAQIVHAYQPVAGDSWKDVINAGEFVPFLKCVGFREDVGCEELNECEGKAFPPGCDWKCYADNNKDLVNLKKTFKAAWDHYMNRGKSEGRSCVCTDGDKNKPLQNANNTTVN